MEEAESKLLHMEQGNLVERGRGRGIQSGLKERALSHCTVHKETPLK